LRFHEQHLKFITPEGIGNRRSIAGNHALCGILDLGKALATVNLSMGQPAIHTFDNGVRILDAHLLEVQRARYRQRNVHEADEEDVFLAALADIPSGGIFLNVGTAVGYYVILAKLKRPDLTIHGVEPLPGQAERFKENLAINGLGSTDFKLHEIAIAANDEAEAQLLDDSYGSRLLGPAEQVTGKVVRVRTIPLAELCRSIGPRIDLLQMDIQGLELPVLEKFFGSAERSAISTFLVGTHSEKIHASVIALLNREGYAVSFECARPSGQPDGIVLAGKQG
jgi:FkbM family methyltransferase